MADPAYGAIIVGAGQAGLAVSHFLKRNGIEHAVFEQGRIGESWRSQRWDSFTLNSPNWSNVLPGDSYEGERPQGFYSTSEYVASLEHYAVKFQLPVRQYSRVLALERGNGAGTFRVTVSEHGAVRSFNSRHVVVASGMLNQKRIPPASGSLPHEILQLHAGEYRNASRLPSGAVLVVGSAQSGCQIAEDLIDAGRKVFLSTSLVPRMPRRYRGKDIVEWLVAIGFYDMPAEKVPDPQMLTMKQPQISGLGPLGHSLSLQSLARRGAVILGKLSQAEGRKVWFEPNAATHVRFADGFSQMTKQMIDAFITEKHLDAPQSEPDPADEPDPEARCASSVTSLDLAEENIRTVIWTTGFKGDFGWIKLPVLGADGTPKFSGGISEFEGLYFVGFPWLRKRKSGVIFGVREDAEFIARRIIEKCSV